MHLYLVNVQNGKKQDYFLIERDNIIDACNVCASVFKGKGFSIGPISKRNAIIYHKDANELLESNIS